METESTLNLFHKIISYLGRNNKDTLESIIRCISNHNVACVDGKMAHQWENLLSMT